MSTDRAGSNWNRWKRRAAALVAASTTIAAPLALMSQPVSADANPITDAGMTLQVAQATATDTNGINIAWQGTATVVPSQDTLVRAQYYNNGDLPTYNATMTIHTGGRLDPTYTAGPDAATNFGANGPCSVSSGDTEDVVTCSYGTVNGTTPEPWVYLAIETGAAGSSITTTGREVSYLSSLVPVNSDGDDQASVTTTVASNAGVAFLTDGQSLTFTSADGKVYESFTVPAHATNGGGFFVRLYEASTAGYTCSLQSCYGVMGKSDFLQVGGTTSPTVLNPLQQKVSYLLLKQSCNGLGGPSGCNPIFYTTTTQTSGVAQQVPLCSTYVSNGSGAPVASHDPCVYSLTKTTAGIVTYSMALLTDPGWPVLGI